MDKIYNYLFKELEDPRVSDWPLMSDPLGISIIICLYLCVILKILPWYMSDKEPYDIKEMLLYYNIFQIVACAYLFYQIATSGWTTHYTFGCQLIDYTENHLAILMWQIVILKVIDMIETHFFVLRKKYNQVSKLHLIHHVLTLVCAWIMAKYFPGGMAAFPWLLNCFIHVLMYIYYLLNLFGPKVQTMIAPLKPILTFLQILHSLIIMLHSLQTFLPGCGYSSWYGWLMIISNTINICLFTEFYIKSYLKKEKQV